LHPSKARFVTRYHKYLIIKVVRAELNDKPFELYDLRVEVIASEKPMVCNHVTGSYFLVEGESLVFSDVNHFPMYPLAALLPLLPAKQRLTHEHDWMSTDADIACPDPHCGGRFRVTRLGKRTFTHAETTGLPGERGRPHWQKGPSDD
jgi:uncharacterized repeat protein (TIGR04076 family)